MQTTALMADTRFRLKGVSIGGTMSTYATLACLGGGCYGSGIDFLIVPPLPLHGWGSEGDAEPRMPRGVAPYQGEASSGKGKATLVT